MISPERGASARWTIPATGPYRILDHLLPWLARARFSICGRQGFIIALMANMDGAACDELVPQILEAIAQRQGQPI
jgi:hypothetical protein